MMKVKSVNAAWAAV